MESALNRLALMTPVSLYRSIIVKEILIIGAGGFLGGVLRYVAVLSIEIAGGDCRLQAGGRGSPHLLSGSAR